MLAFLRPTNCCLCSGSCDRRDAEVVEEVLHADAEGLVVAVDGGPVRWLASAARAAHAREDGGDDLVAEGEQGGDGAGRLGRGVVAAGPGPRGRGGPAAGRVPGGGAPPRRGGGALFWPPGAGGGISGRGGLGGAGPGLSTTSPWHWLGLVGDTFSAACR